MSVRVNQATVSMTLKHLLFLAHCGKAILIRFLKYLFVALGVLNNFQENFHLLIQYDFVISVGDRSS